MSDPSWPYQQALYSAMHGTLTNVDGGLLPIYDQVPDKAPKPYLAFDYREAIPDDPLASRRSEVFVYLSVWSTYGGQREVLHVMGQVDQLLHQQRLDLSEGRLVRMYVTRRHTQRQDDGVTWSGNVTIRALIEH